MGKQKRPDFSCIHVVAQQLLAKFRRDVNQQLIINNRGRVCTNVFSLTYTGLLTVLTTTKGLGILRMLRFPENEFSCFPLTQNRVLF